MNKEEIEEFFYAYCENHIKEILKFIDFKNYPEFEGLSYDEIDDMVSLVESEDEKIVKEVMAKIEKGDYQYFLSLKNDRNNIGYFAYMAAQGSNKELIYDLLNNYYEYEIPKTILKSLILGTNDLDCVRKWIKKGVLPQMDVLEMLRELDNPKIVKEFLKSKPDIIKCGSLEQSFIALTKDKKKIVKEINKCQKAKRKVYPDLIEATNDFKMIKDIIRNSSEYRLTSEDVCTLAIFIKDKELEKKMVENWTKYDLEPDEIKNLVIAIGNEDYIDSAIKKRKEFCFSLSDVLELMLEYGKDKYSIKDISKIIKEYSYDDADELINEQGDLGYNKSMSDSIDLEKGKSNEHLNNETNTLSNDVKINLPPQMTVGIEIECIGHNSENIKELVNKFGFVGNWNAKDDGSLGCHSVEVTSPILTYDHTKSLESIKNVCNMLNELGQKVNQTCGGHIHIGADYLTSKESYINLLEICSNSEKEIFIISNESGEKTRTGARYYSRFMSGSLEKFIDKGNVKIDNIRDVKSLAKNIESDRYFGVNFQNLGKKKKNTIEFRMPNGTINPKTWIENINLFGGIVKASEELSNIQLKPEEERTEDEKKKIDAFNKMKSVDSDSNEILDSLLELCIRKEDRHIYKERFEANYNLFNTYLEEYENSGKSKKNELAHEKIDIRAKILAVNFAKDKNVASKREEAKNINDVLLGEKDKNINDALSEEKDKNISGALLGENYKEDINSELSKDGSKKYSEIIRNNNVLSRKNANRVLLGHKPKYRDETKNRKKSKEEEMDR